MQNRTALSMVLGLNGIAMALLMTNPTRPEWIMVFLLTIPVIVFSTLDEENDELDTGEFIFPEE